MLRTTLLPALGVFLFVAESLPPPIARAGSPQKIQTEIVDIWTDYGRFPFAEAVRTYKFLGKRPLLWKLSYDMARFPPTR